MALSSGILAPLPEIMYGAGFTFLSVVLAGIQMVSLYEGHVTVTGLHGAHYQGQLVLVWSLHLKCSISLHTVLAYDFVF